MKIIDNVKELQSQLNGLNSIGFVPTMGALHSGHIELVKRARKENETVVVSVFVNPTQFNDKGDLERYPRTLENDAKLLAEAGVDFLFAPSVEEVYPANEEYTITDSRMLPLTKVMEGAHRPGHFDGVVQVVGRLFDIVNPKRGYFGLKDYQQVAILCCMVEIEARDLEIIKCDIVRADDGLALSSRNTLLTPEQRAVAPEIHKALLAVREAIDGGNFDFEELKKSAILQIDKNEYLCTQYIEIVDAKTLQSPVSGSEVRICAAVMCGEIRLIDNI